MANAWGLHDVHGNVWEWCVDSYDESGGSNRVVRGGSWNWDTAGCRSANRHASAPTIRNPNIGFRLALSLPSAQSPEADR